MCPAAAFTCYQTALQLRPNFPQGLNNLAVVFTAQGRAQDALQMLQAAIAAAPDYAEAYNNLGVLQREVGAIQVSPAAPLCKISLIVRLMKACLGYHLLPLPTGESCFQRRLSAPMS